MMARDSSFNFEPNCGLCLFLQNLLLLWNWVLVDERAQIWHIFWSR